MYGCLRVIYSYMFVCMFFVLNRVKKYGKYISEFEC